jgi:hypothetical protein
MRSTHSHATRFAAGLALTLALTGPAGLLAQDTANDQSDDSIQEVTVYGQASSGDTLVGPYDQPAWTARQQRWGTTRAYVLPPGRFEFEVFTNASGEADDGNGPEWEVQEELKIGLPYRTQLDLYLVQARPSGGEFSTEEYKIELRHALADWGEIPLNPTAYIEYEGDTDFDTAGGLEYKLLLAETVAPKLHAATNLIFEHSLEEDKLEYGVSGGVSYTVSENLFSIGAEGELIKEDAGSEQKVEALVGPSFEFRPTRNTSVRVSPLFGIGSDSPDYSVFAIFGIGFGPGEEGAEYIGPAGSEMR